MKRLLSFLALSIVIPTMSVSAPLPPDQREELTRTLTRSPKLVPDIRRRALAPNHDRRQRQLTDAVPPFSGRGIGLSVANKLQGVRNQINPRHRLSDAQQLALNRVLQSSGNETKVDFDRATGTAVHLEGDDLARGGTPEQMLDALAPLFRLDNGRAELRLTWRWTDHLGQTHSRYQQMLDGYPVWARELVVHQERDGRVRRVFARTLPTPKLAARVPLIARTVAENTARDSVNDIAKIRGSDTVIYPRQMFGSRLAYKVTIDNGLLESWDVFIDALDGRVLHRLALHRTAGNTVTGSGSDLLGVSRSFTAWQENGIYYLLDPTTPRDDGGETPLQNYRQVGDFYVFNCANTDCSSIFYITSNSATSGWSATGVSAYHNVRTTFEYYLDTFGRGGIDGNDETLVTLIHVDSGLENAFWTNRAMYFGDGATTFFPLARCLDVAAHEMTHGVIESTANLVYEFQPGALNESLADVFGAMVDRADWRVGEDCTRASPGYLRSLSTPSSGLNSQPAHMDSYQVMPVSQDYGGVHVNSGIPNRAAYLLAEGLTTEGLGTAIGRDKTEQLYYRALTTYLLKYSQFIDMRKALVAAATDLYPGDSSVTNAISTAFDAVGIVENGSTPTSPSPVGGTPVSGFDIAAYLQPADGVYDTTESLFYLIAQFLDDPYTGYDVNQIFGPLNSAWVAPTRPAVFVSEGDPYILYVTTDNQLVAVLPDGSNVALSDPGQVFSVAANRDGTLLAFTTPSATDDNIYVMDLSGADPVVIPFPIALQNYQADGAAAPSILFADALAFNYLDNKIIFDALACTSTPDSSCGGGGGSRYWTVGVLHDNGAVQYPFIGAPQFDLGFPMPAYNNDHILAFDVVDYSVSGQVTAFTVLFDTNSAEVISGVQRYQTAGPIDGTRLFGVPAFWGDDTGLAMQIDTSDSGQMIELGRFPLNTDFTIASFTETEMHPADSAFASLFRSGTRTGGLLSASALTLAFGTVDVGGSASRSLTLTNSGGADVTIQQITRSNSRYTHNLVPTLIPRGQSVIGTVTFEPAANGTSNGTLSFVTDQGQTLVVSLTGTGATAPSPGGGGGGGGSLVLRTQLPLLLVALGLLVLRIRKRTIAL